MSSNGNDFFIIQLECESCIVLNNKLGIELSVNIPSKDQLNPITTRKKYKEAIGNGRFWLAGGGSYLINEKYLVLIRRSIDAYTNPGKLSLATGRSDGYEELLNPPLIIRELFEELAIIEGDSLVLPELSNSDLCLSNDDILNLSISGLSNIKIRPKGVVWKSANLNRNINKDFLLLSSKSEVREQLKCCLCIGEKNRDINILYVVEIKNLDLAKIKLFDMELDENISAKHLNREIYLLDITSNLLVYTTTSEGFLKPYLMNDSYDLKITEHASFLIERLKNGV